MGSQNEDTIEAEINERTKIRKEKAMRFMEKLSRFFMGRYGIDSLYTALTVICFALMIANLFIGSLIITAIVFALLIWAMYRSMSRNIPARRRENEIWVKIWKKITFGKGPVRNYTPYDNSYSAYGGYQNPNGYGSQSDYSGFGGQSAPPKRKKGKLKTDKDHCFRICPGCRANIRLPKKKGKHTVVCPACKCRFEVKI